MITRRPVTPGFVRPRFVGQALAGAMLVALAALGLPRAAAQTSDDAFLAWTKGEATEIVTTMRRTDQVGSRMSFRGLKTDQAINYKMRATWLTPDVIRATARVLQLDERMGPDQARQLVAEAEAAADTVVFVELDPHEGSGVIPLDWIALLQPRGLPRGEAGAVRGVLSPKLRDIRALGGVGKRDYAYDHFWVAFTFTDADRTRLFGPDAGELELVVSIRGRDGIVAWPVPESARQRLGRPASPAR